MTYYKIFSDMWHVDNLLSNNLRPYHRVISNDTLWTVLTRDTE